jgi:hypothetical protein
MKAKELDKFFYVVLLEPFLGLLSQCHNFFFTLTVPATDLHGSIH